MALIYKMEPKKFKIGNYITVPGFAIVELGLSGNELICYSLVYGFTQDEETEFKGSLTYIASALNITKQNAKKVIDRLIERGLIVKREMYFSGVKFCHYVAVRNSNGVAETATGCYRNSNGGVAETATPKDNILHINNDNISAVGGLFPETVIVPEKDKRGTAENLCLFANSRYSDYEQFAKCFSAPEFAEIDINYYFHAVSDWSAQHGKKMHDWIATARNFIRGDMKKGCVHKLNNDTGGLTPDALKYLHDCAEGL